MQSPSLDPAQQSTLHSPTRPRLRQGAQLRMQASALTIGQPPKRLGQATLAPRVMSSSLSQDAVSDCGGWRCFVDVMMGARRATRGIFKIIRLATSRQALWYPGASVFSEGDRETSQQPQASACPSTVRSTPYWWKRNSSAMLRQVLFPTRRNGVTWSPPHSDGPERVGTRSAKTSVNYG